MGEPTQQDRYVAATATATTTTNTKTNTTSAPDTNTTSTPTRHASHKYRLLKEAALAFLNAQAYQAAMEEKMDLKSLRGVVSSCFLHVFGPAYSVSQAPKLQGGFSIDGFIAHLGGMVPLLECWEMRVKSLVVDEVGESVVVRVGYGMRVKGAEEVVENDVVWWLELEMEDWPAGSEVGDGSRENGGWKIRKSTEMVDAGAAGRIRELMMGGRGGSSG